jgi:hypothetical protein
MAAVDGRRRLLGHRRRQDHLNVDVDGGEDRGQRGGHRVRQPAAHPTRQDLHQVAEGPHRVEQRPDEYAEADQQADLGHDLAEPPSDRLHGPRGPEPGREPEVNAREQQRDHRVDLELDDQQDRREDRDR